MEGHRIQFVLGILASMKKMATIPIKENRTTVKMIDDLFTTAARSNGLGVTYSLPLASYGVKAGCISQSIPISASPKHKFIATTITFKAQLQTIICREIQRCGKILRIREST